MHLRIVGFAQPQVMSRSFTLMVSVETAIKNGVKHVEVKWGHEGNNGRELCELGLKKTAVVYKNI